MLSLINAAEYAVCTMRHDQIDRTIAWLESKGRDEVQLMELRAEREELGRRMFRIETLDAYDELID